MHITGSQKVHFIHCAQSSNEFFGHSVIKTEWRENVKVYIFKVTKHVVSVKSIILKIGSNNKREQTETGGQL